jgi:SAM-dependent methyltransferase
LITFNKLLEYLKKPALYTESSCKFWDDEHISKGMLEAHLNPQWDAASRKHDFIDRSVEWISGIAPLESFKKVLDLGCGPGIYAERMCSKGYEITGIDFSKRSIEYASAKARENNQPIEYIYKNYLDIEYNNAFDLVLLIYCDFGALSDWQRAELLNRIYRAMRPGGKFIFDVFTPEYYKGKEESKTWGINENGGFWRAGPHICIQSHHMYENNTRLDQYVLIDETENLDVVRIWDHYYTRETIIEELKEAGFEKFEICSDVAGKEYNELTETMCIVVEK